MRQADHQVHFFLIPEDFHHVPGGLDRVAEFQGFGERRDLNGVFPQNSKDADLQSAALQNRMAFHAGFRKRVFQIRQLRLLAVKTSVGENHLRRAAAGFGGPEGGGQPCRLEIEFMVAQANDVIAHVFQQAKFESFLPVQHVKKRSHGVIARVHDEDGIGFFSFDSLDHGGHARPAADGLIGVDFEGLIVNFRRKALEMGMHVIGVHDGDRFSGRPAAGCEKHDGPDSDDARNP